MPETILYVDDDARLVGEFRPMLEQAGFIVEHAADAASALGCASRRAPALVLIEVLLPDRDGYSLVEQLMAEAAPRPLPVIVVTRGDRTPELYGRGLELGVEDFLCKPVTRAQVLEAVLDCMQFVESSEQVAEAPPPAPPSFSGDLAVDLLPALLGQLHRAGATGVLSLRSGSRTGALELRNGTPVQVSLEQDVESVADYLLKTKRIDAEQHQMLLDHLMARLAGPREILLGMGALGEKELAAAATEQAQGLLNVMCTWSSGDFSFEEGAHLDASDALELAGRAEEIIVAGTKRLDAACLGRVLDRQADLYVFVSADRDDRFTGLGLTVAQREALFALSGEQTLAEVLDRGTLDPLTLYRLLASGRIELDRAPVLVLEEELKPVECEEPLLELDSEDAVMAPDISRRQLPRRRVVDDGSTEATIRAIAEKLEARDDFALFGIDDGCRDSEVRAAYDRLRTCLTVDHIPPELDELRALARKLLPSLDQAYGRMKTADARAAFAGLSRRQGKSEAGDPEAAPAAAQSDAERAREAETWFRTGEGHLAHENYGQAVEAFGMAVHCDPTQGDYHAHLGYSMFRSNPTQEIIRREALEHVAKGVKLSPGREKPLLFLGRIFRESGETQTAAKVLRRALKLSPDSPALVQEMCLIEGTSKRSNRGFLSRFRKR